MTFKDLLDGIPHCLPCPFMKLVQIRRILSLLLRERSTGIRLASFDSSGKVKSLIGSIGHFGRLRVIEELFVLLGEVLRGQLVGLRLFRELRSG